MDINRGRVLKVKSVMEAGAKGGDIQIDGELALEEAMQKMKAQPDSPATVMQDGAAVGSLNMRALMR